MGLTDRVRFFYECPLVWEKLTGDERVRHCAECHTHVTNLSVMSEEEAHEFLLENPGRVCVRLQRDHDGRPVHRPRLRTVAGAALIAAATAAVAAEQVSPGCLGRAVNDVDEAIFGPPPLIGFIYAL